MCKLKNIIFLIFLMSPINAQLDPDLTSILFDEIDEYLSELISNHQALMNHYSLCPAKRERYETKILNASRTNVIDDSTLLPMVNVKLKILKHYLHSQKLAKECSNIENNVEKYTSFLMMQPLNSESEYKY
ncbi:uncharacterized protein LOC110179180 [Drosophila serrata]|uniref:uncharacterized protein LOC110179180 n=1 Tax=Drosophila serrata TaxID=7274 RepID=UPI000A1D1FE8|nr:uncharacterized protein LOC110179180 [Drosophila serrata]